MFNEIIPQIIQPKDINFDEPRFIAITKNNDEHITTSLEKGASNFIYKMYGIKESTSKMNIPVLVKKK